MEKSSLKRKWLIYAVSGLILMGFGFSLLGESIILKSKAADFWTWFGSGTLALSVTFAGLSLFGQAVAFKSRLDQWKKP